MVELCYTILLFRLKGEYKMNSHNTCDDRHFLATNVVCALVLTACLVVWVIFRNGTEEKDEMTSAAALVILAVVAVGWVNHLINNEKRVFAALGALWENIWLHFAGRFSPGGARHLISTGTVRHHSFAWRDHGDAKIVPPDLPED